MRLRGIGIVRFVAIFGRLLPKWILALKTKILWTTSFVLIYSLPWFLLVIKIILRFQTLAWSLLWKCYATSKIENFSEQIFAEKKKVFYGFGWQHWKNMIWTVFLSFRFATGGPGFGAATVFVCLYSDRPWEARAEKNLDSLNGSQRDHFPVGELARKRATLRAEYLSKSKELCHLQKQGQRLQKKVFRLNLI